MSQGTTIYDFHGRLLRDTFGRGLDDRDAFLIFLRFLAARRKRTVLALDFGDLTPDAVLAFLDHLETERNNGAATRNARLAAVHAFAGCIRTLRQIQAGQRPMKHGERVVIEV